VLVEFRAPRSAVLLSDFEAWHCVLNDAFLSLSQEEDDAFEARHGGRTRAGERSAACQAEIEASWERIFDLLDLRWPPEAGGWSHSGVVQAVVREVPLRSVVRATPFVAR
jgi:hypothetical protein